MNGVKMTIHLMFRTSMFEDEDEDDEQDLFDLMDGDDA